jgi:hypothetical protein
LCSPRSSRQLGAPLWWIRGVSFLLSDRRCSSAALCRLSPIVRPHWQAELAMRFTDVQPVQVCSLLRWKHVLPVICSPSSLLFSGRSDPAGHRVRGARCALCRALPLPRRLTLFTSPSPSLDLELELVPVRSVRGCARPHRIVVSRRARAVPHPCR